MNSSPPTSSRAVMASNNCCLLHFQWHKHVTVVFRNYVWRDCNPNQHLSAQLLSFLFADARSRLMNRFASIWLLKLRLTARLSSNRLIASEEAVQHHVIMTDKRPTLLIMSLWWFLTRQLYDCVTQECHCWFLKTNSLRATASFASTFTMW